MVDRGSHEAVVWGLVGEGGMSQPDLFTAAGTLGLPLTLLKNFPGAAGKVGFSKAMSAGWITLDKAAKPPLVKRKVSAIEDAVQVLNCKRSSLLRRCALYSLWISKRPKIVHYLGTPVCHSCW